MVQIITTERVVTDKGSKNNAGKIEDGTLRGQVFVGKAAGNAYVLIDGDSNRLIIHDGTVPRIVIGNV